MGYGSKGLNEWRDDALRIAVEHGFKDATIAEDFALMHSEISEALEDHRDGKRAIEVWYEEKRGNMVEEDGASTIITTSVIKHKQMTPMVQHPLDDIYYKPCGIPSELADIIIRVLHFSGKHGIDIEQAVREKMLYNETRPFMHGKKL